jgi:OPA family glycerol-3-phosphate transporter-like MFS transporter
MVVGYSGYYLCRSNFSVTIPLIATELGSQGMGADEAKSRLGDIASLGVLAYAFGKFVSGGLADFLGGRRMYLGGMLGAVLFTVVFASGGTLPIFTMAWLANRLVQSLGWVGMVKITSRWFSFRTYGTVMGVLSLSFLFGDAASRWFMGQLIDAGFGWQAVFFTAGCVLLAIFVVNLLLLRESPQQIGEPEPAANPDNLFGDRGQISKPTGLASLLAPLLSSLSFWVACILSLTYTLLRETFNTWTAMYFIEVVGLTKGDAARLSALFPLFGGLAVLVVGLLSDVLGRKSRATILLIGLLASGGLLLCLAHGDFGEIQWQPVAVVTLLGFVLLGPYSFLSGAVSLDFGGKQGSATACGIIDGVGYLGAVLAGGPVARLTVWYSWSRAFEVLAAMAFVSSLAAALYLVLQFRMGNNAVPADQDRDDAYI